MTRSHFMMALAISSLFAVQSFATQITAFSQAPAIPATGDYGVLSSRFAAPGVDPLSTMAFDNFSIAGTGSYDLAGLCWHGIYDEPFPMDPADTDFLVNIYGDDSGAPDLGNVVLSYFLAAGEAGASDEDVITTDLGYDSPAGTDGAAGGGNAYAYEAALAGSLMGDTPYWISIQALQTFPNTENDPLWSWHLSDAGDGFYAQDTEFDPVGTPGYGLWQSDKDLAFELKVVPEPSGIALVFAGVLGLGLVRRRR